MGIMCRCNWRRSSLWSCNYIDGGTATVPSAFIATPAIATASGVLGMSTTISAIGIAIAGGGVGALNKLRGYRVEKVSDEKVILHKK